MAPKLQIKRGLKKDLPTLASGEFGLCEDTGELFVGTQNGNLPVRSEAGAGDMLKSVYDTDNDGVVDRAESVPWAGVTGKPASLPANGGNADTLDGKHASEFASAAQGSKADAAVPAAGGVINGHLTVISSIEADRFTINKADGYFNFWEGGREFFMHADGNNFYFHTRKDGVLAAIMSVNANGIATFSGNAATASIASKIRISGADASILYNENSDWVYINRGGKIIDYHQAKRAIGDESGNAIKSTYIAGVDHSGNTLRFKNKNGTVLFSETPPYATKAAASASGTFPIGSGKIVSRESQKLAIYASDETNFALFFGVTSVTKKWTLAPDFDNRVWLGDPNYRWNQIYSTQPSISTSDRSRKTDIQSLDTATALSFLRLLQPVSYKMLDGSSGRTHWGLIAQDVWDAMQQVGLSERDFAGYCRDLQAKKVQVVREQTIVDPEDGDVLGVEDTLGEEEVLAISEDGAPEYIYGLRYEEFIPLAVLGAQEGLRRAEALEAENQALKDALAALMEQQRALDRRLAVLEAK